MKNIKRFLCGCFCLFGDKKQKENKIKRTDNEEFHVKRKELTSKELILLIHQLSKEKQKNDLKNSINFASDGRLSKRNSI